MARYSTATFLFTLALFLSSMSMGKVVLIPKPDGPYDVGLGDTKLVDLSRNDALEASPEKRKIMISLFYPVEKDKCWRICPVEYMPAFTANYTELLLNLAGFNIPEGTVKDIKLQVCCKPNSGGPKKEYKYPVVLYSPGLGATRLDYSCIAQALASAGFIVATIDHSHDSRIIEFPGETKPVYGDIITSDDVETNPKFLNVRVDDLEFVRKALQNPAVVKKLIPDAKEGLDTRKIAVCGHSLGGTTAVRILNRGGQYVAACNFDGPQARVDELKSIWQPVLLFGTAEPFYHNSTNEPTWVKLLPRLKGWWREMGLKNSTHPVFCDTPFLFYQLHKQGVSFNTGAVEQFVGYLDGATSFKIVTFFQKVFMEYSLKQGSTTFLDHPNITYSDVKLVSRSSA